MEFHGLLTFQPHHRTTSILFFYNHADSMTLPEGVRHATGSTQPADIADAGDPFNRRQPMIHD